MLGLRYMASIPIRFISVTACNWLTFDPSCASRSRNIWLPTKGNPVYHFSIRCISFCEAGKT